MPTRRQGLTAVEFIFLATTLLGCAEKMTFYANNLKADIYTQAYTARAYDFLWVLDNSPSMDSKRQYLADNIQTFLNTLNSRKAIDYQMAIVNVDPLSTPGGQLISTSQGLNVVKSRSSSNPAQDFSSLVSAVTYTPTSFWEQGLLQSYLAVINSGSQFLRSGSALTVIYLTDDDDWSCSGMLNGNTQCLGAKPENNPDIILYETSFFINFFGGIASLQNNTVTLFPIIGTSDASCVVERVGTRYQKVATQVGGGTATGGLCPDSIGNSLSAIAQTIADRGIRFALTSHTDGKQITVSVNGQTVANSEDNGYIYDASTNSIIFTGSSIPAKGQTIEIHYSVVSTS